MSDIPALVVQGVPSDLRRTPIVFDPLLLGPARACADCGSRLMMFWDCNQCDPVANLWQERNPRDADSVATYNPVTPNT